MVDSHRHFGYIVLLPLPGFSETFPEQKRPSAQFRNYSYLTFSDFSK